MIKKQKPKGPWINRFATRLFTVALAVLIFWSLGFFVRDIKSVKGPDYNEIEKQYVDQSLTRKTETLGIKIDDLDRQINSRNDEQQVVGDSSENLQQTINQLIELQKLSIQKDISLSETEQSNLSTSLALFLKSQEQYQDLNANMSGLMAEKRELENEKRKFEQKIEEQRKPAKKKFDKLTKEHKMKLAAIQLLILLPLLVFAVILIIKKLNSIYFPLFLAFGSATIIKVTLVIHEYFPTKYFKYIIIAVLLLAVGRLLIYFIRVVAFPKVQWLIKQYREAYERFLCPVCEYPIRIGPRKFLYWTRRTINKVPLINDKANKEESYTCPSCGTVLLEECPGCRQIRHSLLPYCQHCGVEKEMG